MDEALRISRTATETVGVTLGLAAVQPHGVSGVAIHEVLSLAGGAPTQPLLRAYAGRCGTPLLLSPAAV